jgi:hypothetical protein
MDKYTEGILRNLDKEIKKKFKLSLIEVIENPSDYISRDGIDRKLANIEEYVDSAIGAMIDGAKDSAKVQDLRFQKSEDLTRKIASYVKAHAMQNGIPIIAPSALEVRLEGRDRFYVNDLDASVSRFIERLIDSSKFIIDMTENIGDRKVGAWLFSGDKDVVVGVHCPRSSMSMMRASRAEILHKIREAADSIRGL